MAELSQRSVGQMTRVFEKLGCYDDPSYTGIHTPLVSAKDLKRELYERNFDRAFLETCAPTNPYAKQWDFDRIFPKLHDGSFFISLPRGRSWPAIRDRLEYLSDSARQTEAIEKGRTLLLRFAEYLFDKSHSLPDYDGWHVELEQLLNSLELDGFRLHQGKLIPADTAIFDQPKQVSLLVEQIKTAKLSSEQTLLHHFSNGERAYLDGKYDTAVGEWRKFFERLLRDIAEDTGVYRQDLKKDATKLTMKVYSCISKKLDFLTVTRRWHFQVAGAFSPLVRILALAIKTRHILRWF